MPPGHIIGHLDNILHQEGIEFDPQALRLLAQGASGSMRDALSLTDQAIAYAAGRVSLEAVQGMLGALDQTYLVRILDALAAQDGSGLIAVADDMASRSLSYNAALQDLGTLLHQVALAQSVPAALAEDLPDRADIVHLASQFSPEHVQLFYQIVVHGRNELGLAPDEYAGFSMTLLRMLAFRPVSASAGAPPSGGAPAPRPAPTRQAAPLAAAPQVAVASAPVSRAPVAAPAAAMAVPVVTAPSAPAGPVSAREAAMMALRANNGKGVRAPSATRPAAAAPVAPVSMPAPAAAVAAPEPAGAPSFDDIPPPWEQDVRSGAPEAQKKTEPAVVEPMVTAAPQRPAASPAQQQETTRIAAELGWDGHWPSLAASLPLRGVVHQMAFQSELVRCEALAGGNVCFHLRIPLETLRSSGAAEKLMAALSERFAREVRIETEIGRVADTANAVAESERAQRQQEAEQSMNNDPFVLSMMREFNATIVPGSIHPL